MRDSEKELVGSCYYIRGVFLNYQQMYFMTHQLFDDEYILCCPFVHKINSMNVNGHHMVFFHCFFFVSVYLFIYLFLLSLLFIVLNFCSFSDSLMFFVRLFLVLL